MAYSMSAKDGVEFVEKLTGWSFNNKAIAFEALVMDPGMARFQMDTSDVQFVNKNERLSLVGTGLVESVLVAKWYSQLWSKETWDTIKNDLTSINALAERGFQYAVDGAVVRNVGQAHEKVSKRCMAMTVKAIIGAVYVDGGDARVVMERLGFFDYAMLKA